MHLEATQTFIRRYKKLPSDIQDRAKKALELLQSNPGHPSLGHKKMAGQRDIFDLRVSQNYRITYQKIGTTAYLRKIGTHNLLRYP
ncbi:MAG: hypothetical protein A3G87_10370 [Omnitrophica bacterium RIFCSPLOWO2_12_FULL_50_11]|nr:MAG: hypothetical protein A3G87_10370 [Omnitrophica bacterium RIFCSPLOWO2_12_FULL_50_11]